MRTCFFNLCPVCRRPAGASRHCPYCDEPLPQPKALRRLRILAAVLALAGVLLVRFSAGSSLPLAEGLAGYSGLAVSLAIGALSGVRFGFPLPFLLLAAGVCPRMLAVAAGANFIGQTWRNGDPTGRTGGISGKRKLPLFSGVESVVRNVAALWGLSLALQVLPNTVLSTLQLLLRRHGGWGLAAIFFSLALVQPPDEGSDSSDRRHRLLKVLRPPCLALAYLGLGLAGGIRLAGLAEFMLPALLGLWFLAPAIERRILPVQEGSAREAEYRTLSLSPGIHLFLLLLMLLGAASRVGDVRAVLLLFPASATILACLFRLLDKRIPHDERHAGPARTGVLAFLVAGSFLLGGMQGIGLASVGAAFGLLGLLWNVPPVLSFSLWLPRLLP